MDSIVEMDLPDLDETLYNYQQVKRLLLKFGLPWRKTMKKPARMAALRTYREQQLAASASVPTTAPHPTDPADDTIDEAAQLLIAAEQVAASDAEEELLDPSPDVNLTKATHGAEMEELDAKLAKIEEEMNAMRAALREDIADTSAASGLRFKENEFKEGMKNINLRITQQALHLKSVAESLDERFPGEPPFTSFLISSDADDTEGEKPPAKKSRPAALHKELYYGFEHKDGRRTCCPARNEVEDSRLRRNGWILTQYSYSHDEILQWMTRSLKEPPEPPAQPQPVDLRGGGSAESGGAATNTSTDDIPRTTLTANIAEAFLSGADKRAELRRQLGMDKTTGESPTRALIFEGEKEDNAPNTDGTGTENTDSARNKNDTTTHRFDAFRQTTTKFQHDRHTGHGDEEDNLPRSNRKDNGMGTPTHAMPTNPYNSGQTPLTDKYLGQCNDFYLNGVDGLARAADFTQDYYDKFHLPDHLFSNIRYDFCKLIDDYETPYLDDKQIRNLPQLTSLNPETFVDWYSTMADELMMITRVALLPFDAIKIQYQYVGLCIPGVGERRFMDMGKILYRA